MGRRELLDKPDRILYEDDIAVAVLADKPAAKGHVIVIPKRKNARFVEDLTEDEETLFI